MERDGWDFEAGRKPRRVCSKSERRKRERASRGSLKISKETNIERLVRLQLEKKKIHFLQEYPVRIGKQTWYYHLDFYIPSLKLDIECDGEYWHSSKTDQARDRRKDKKLKSIGISVYRLRGKEIIDNPVESVNRALASVS